MQIYDLRWGWQWDAKITRIAICIKVRSIIFIVFIVYYHFHSNIHLLIAKRYHKWQCGENVYVYVLIVISIKISLFLLFQGQYNVVFIFNFESHFRLRFVSISIKRFSNLLMVGNVCWSFDASRQKKLKINNIQDCI